MLKSNAVCWEGGIRWSKRKFISIKCAPVTSHDDTDGDYSIPDFGCSYGCVFDASPHPLYHLDRISVHILQVAGWAPGPICTGEKRK
jgi:hypothetical protein